MEKWVGLLDCNNFFVSCERLFRPDLKHRPVVVLSSNDGCVVARSKEIKDKGIAMGVPYFHIKDTLKDIGAVTFSSHFALYRDISRRVFEVMRRELESVEQYSVDEAFFTLSGDYRSVLSKIDEVKVRVEREVGIPVSIGVARSKTQAKYASTVAKGTNGLYVLSSPEQLDELAAVRLSEIWGVGAKSAETYKKHMVTTVGDLLPLERRQVKGLFGVQGERLWLELQGIQSGHAVRLQGSKQSILSSRSFKKTTEDIAVLKDAVAYHVRHAGEDLRRMQMKASCIQVMLSTSRHSDFFLQGGSEMVVLSAPTSDSFELLKVADRITETLYKPYVPYKKVGILLSQFSPETVEQLSIFSDAKKSVTNDLMPVIDKLNQQNGSNSILLGSHLKTTVWQSSMEARSPAYTTNWNDIAKVKT